MTHRFCALCGNLSPAAYYQPVLGGGPMGVRLPFCATCVRDRRGRCTLLLCWANERPIPDIDTLIRAVLC